MLKNNVPDPSCIPPAGLEVLIRRFVLVLVLVLERGYSYGLALQFCGSTLSELHPRSGVAGPEEAKGLAEGFRIANLKGWGPKPRMLSGRPD